MSIKINLKIFLFILIFYITKQIQIYAILMLFVLLHEMGHLICGILLGLKPKSLKIMPLGLSIEFKITPEEYNEKIKLANKLAVKKTIIALAGPIVNFLVIFIIYFFKDSIDWIIYQQIVYSNILIALFNLLPIYPLDGGRVIFGIVHIIKGKKKSLLITNQIANLSMICITAISSIAIYYYKNIAILLIIIYLWTITILENRRYSIKKRIYKIIENS